ncbi:ABC transporter ATP-binding protein [Psychrobacter piscatorii]|uniref:ABC transporter ATP-binding protein n=1 Tax=Psychrobacter piscatorii TaxID=554343 RepID=UPI00191B79F6|nr:ABC transporter ATP-binding protein [Psychrobacter piscatorii]
MIELLCQISQVLDREDKLKVLLILFLFLVGGCLEVIGIGIILPYLALLLNPENFEGYVLLKKLYSVLIDYQIISNLNGFYIFLTALVIFFYWLKNLFFIFSLRFQIRFNYEIYRRLSSNLLSKYLKESYLNHINRNTSEIIKNINQQTLDLVQAFLFPILILISECLIVLLLLVFLLFINPLSSLYVFTLLGLTVVVIFMCIRKRLHFSGEAISRSRTEANKQVLQGLGSFKTTKILNKEAFFIQRFNSAISDMTTARRYYELSQNLPRFFLETAIVTVMLSLAMLMLFNGKPTRELILTLSIFGMSGMRLMPSMNRILNALNSTRYSQGIVKSLMHDLLIANFKGSQTSISDGAQPIKNFESLKLDNVHFSYTATAQTLNNLSLTIDANKSIGIVGHSGSGKSTLIDIMLGLLDPDVGEIRVNNKLLLDVKESWQQLIGYIPQDIYLSDDTIKANVAFGIEKNEIDDKQLALVLKTAQLEDLINGLKEGVDTIIGERGIKISGGQRQRIGIARALYHNPQILVMDEATAALDNVTEHEFMQAINKLKGRKTLIMIAHRITTVKNCDIIYVIENGYIIDKGSYQELSSSSKVFKTLAQL